VHISIYTHFTTISLIFPTFLPNILLQYFGRHWDMDADTTGNAGGGGLPDSSLEGDVYSVNAAFDGPVVQPDPEAGTKSALYIK
jgi:hypothetical protein